MEAYEKVVEMLNGLDIPFEIVEHEPALTTEQADSFIEGIEGVRTKTMFLTNKKKTAYYLVIMDDKKRLDMDLLKDLVGANRIRMASSESLFEKMMLPAGVVSPFGLLNNTDKDIQIYFDKEIMSEKRMSFHPNTNENPLFLDTKDILKFLDVRTSGEFQSGRLKVDTIHIPLNELRERLDELDKNQAYIVSCHSGLRSYIAERILKQAGFTVQNLDGAYSLYKMANPEGVEYGN